MFCDCCGRDVPCGAELRERKVSIHGMPILVQYRARICGLCGEEIFDEESEARIMEVSNGQYRAKKNMLPAERLRAFMHEHDLSPEYMAKRTGCAIGEIIAASNGRLLDIKADAQIKKVVGGC